MSIWEHISIPVVVIVLISEVSKTRVLLYIGCLLERICDKLILLFYRHVMMIDKVHDHDSVRTKGRIALGLNLADIVYWVILFIVLTTS